MASTHIGTEGCWKKLEDEEASVDRHNNRELFVYIASAEYSPFLGDAPAENSGELQVEPPYEEVQPVGSDGRDGNVNDDDDDVHLSLSLSLSLSL